VLRTKVRSGRTKVLTTNEEVRFVVRTLVLFCKNFSSDYKPIVQFCLMKTPSHAIINLATLSKTQHSEWNLIIVIGGILPDIPIFYIGDRGHGAVPFPYGDRSLDGCIS
jgi:hypothetical protein